MPGRLAQKVAAASWPMITKCDDDSALIDALRRFANL